jgi:hypothetical protein
LKITKGTPQAMEFLDLLKKEGNNNLLPSKIPNKIKQVKRKKMTKNSLILIMAHIPI